jgi:hypothetical protein
MLIVHATMRLVSANSAILFGCRLFSIGSIGKANEPL